MVFVEMTVPSSDVARIVGILANLYLDQAFLNLFRKQQPGVTVTETSATETSVNVATSGSKAAQGSSVVVAVVVACAGAVVIMVVIMVVVLHRRSASRRAVLLPTATLSFTNPMHGIEKVATRAEPLGNPTYEAAPVYETIRERSGSDVNESSCA